MSMLDAIESQPPLAPTDAGDLQSALAEEALAEAAYESAQLALERCADALSIAKTRVMTARLMTPKPKRAP